MMFTQALSFWLARVLVETGVAVVVLLVLGVIWLAINWRSWR